MGTPKVPVEEPAPVQDIYCSGVSKFEKLGDGNIRVWCYVDQGVAGEGRTESVIVAKVVIPEAAMMAAIRNALEVMEWGDDGAGARRDVH